jgi:hypothetical protein
MDIIEASAKAYVQAVNKLVFRTEMAGRPARKKARKSKPRKA